MLKVLVSLSLTLFAPSPMTAESLEDSQHCASFDNENFAYLIHSMGIRNEPSSVSHMLDICLLQSDH